MRGHARTYSINITFPHSVGSVLFGWFVCEVFGYLQPAGALCLCDVHIFLFAKHAGGAHSRAYVRERMTIWRQKWHAPNERSICGYILNNCKWIFLCAPVRINDDIRTQPVFL